MRVIERVDVGWCGAVPVEATWGVVRLSTRDAQGGGGRFLVHCMQLAPRRSCRDHETQKMLVLTADSPAVLPFQLLVTHYFLLFCFFFFTLSANSQ